MAADTEPAGERAVVLRRLSDDRWARWAHLASLAGAFLLLLVMSRNQWFVQDDWVFAARFSEGGLGAVLDSYDIHWVTAALLAFGATFEGFGFKEYVPYLVPVILLHVLAGHLLWRVMCQAGVQVWVATAVVVAFLLSAPGPSVTMLAIESGGVGSLVLGLLVILLVNRPDDDPRLDRLATAVAVLSLAFSGVSPILIGIGALVVLLRRGWRRAARFIAVPAAVYVVWFLIFGRGGLEQETAAGSLLKIPRFIWSGVVATVEQSTVFEGAGVLAVVALAVWAATRFDLRRTDAAPAFAMALGVIVFFVIVGPARVGLWVRSGEIESRYVYFTWPLLLPLVGLAITSLVRDWTWRGVGALALGGVLAVDGFAGVLDSVRNQERREARVRSLVLASARVVSSGDPYLPDLLIDPDSTPSLTTVRLERYQRDGRLPALPSLSPAQYVQTALPLQSRVASAAPPGIVASPALGAVTGATSTADGTCVRFVPEPGSRPELTVVVSERSFLRLRAEQAGEAAVIGHSPQDPGVTANGDFDLPAGQDVFLELVRARGGWSVLLPGESATLVCRT